MKILSLIFKSVLSFFGLMVFVYPAVLQMPPTEEGGAFTSHFLFLNSFTESSPASIPDFSVPQVSGQSVSEPVMFQKGFLKAVYEKPTLESVRAILEKYKSIPGGVTLEGPALGLPKIQEVLYQPQTNSFLINKELLFHSSLSLSEMKEISEALNKQDLLGVSLGEKNVTYGALPEGSLSDIFLKLSDHFLGCIIFACENWIRFQVFPDHYKPLPDRTTGGAYSVYFNFDQFTFRRDKNQLISEKAQFKVMLIPMLPSEKNEGDFDPDFKKIQNQTLSRNFESNCLHVVRNADFYSSDSRISRVLAFGEWAALVRKFREDGISLKTLFKS